MTIGKINAINPAIGNISFYTGKMPSVHKNFEQTSDYSVQGNPNRPESRSAERGMNIYYLA